VPRDFWLQVFFMNQFLPSSWVSHKGRFHIFAKICGDIRSSRCTTCVVDTSSKWKNSSIRKVLNILFRHLWVVELHRDKFVSSSSLWGVCTLILFLLFATGDQLHQRYQWQIYCRCCWYRGVVDTSGAPWLANISVNFWKKLKWS
jgi:hypothetical protein